MSATLERMTFTPGALTYRGHVVEIVMKPHRMGCYSSIITCPTGEKIKLGWNTQRRTDAREAAERMIDDMVEERDGERFDGCQ